MKDYIAGFRSDNPKNKKKAIIYYILITLFFMIGSNKSLSDIMTLLVLLIIPSLIFNFISMVKKSNSNYPNGKRFASTLIVFIVVIVMLGYLTPQSANKTSVGEIAVQQNKKEAVDNSKVAAEENKKQNTVKEVATTQTVTDAEIHFINTGNSDAILIKQGDKSALIDGGDNDDEGRVVSYLNKQGVKELEYIFATHPHADHIGGLDAVVKSITVKNIFVSNGTSDTDTYTDFIHAMTNKGLNPSVPLLNSEFKLGSSTFKVLSVANESEPNNNSLVLLYTNGKDKMLLMGDAETKIENTLNVGDVDLVKIGHHGSNSSSSSSFINNIKPEYAVILTGKDNKYSHPHIETMSTLKNSNIKVHRSDECGDIVFKSTGNGLTVDCKEGSYVAGIKKESSAAKPKNTVPSTIPTKKVSPAPTPKIEEAPKVSNGETVYWTPKGKSYHSTTSCPTLSRSKIINSGTIEESGKYDPCDKCM
ncbi:ComEC/Rec2 family competence protein [Clostridium cylindrosporum]|uniref:Metallo-beta-lactamase superfamily protein n=1 Tax=Clostridium cylindrosporum DSM 605 TaxID=1121307 RepID=A0A0J8DFM5_CLOCY|nr:ComEC/Rec2 family competence protein [Clostridium cylindrosporum]KMT23024.1 metallo-beta-lactamase superfamily protein [Clostridium cylindrosporum DSM 605]